MLLINIFLILEILFFSILSKMKHEYQRFFPWIIMFSLAFVLGIRYNVGMDYKVYEEAFNNPYSWHRAAIEPIWLNFMDFLRFISFKARIFFFLTSLFFVYGYYVGFKRLSPNIYLSFIIFIVIDTFGEGANTIRQSCAQALLFAGTNNFLERKWKKFLPFAIGAIVLHLSAVMGLGLMLLSRIRLKQSILYILLFSSLILGPWLMSRMLDLIMAAVLILGKYNYTPDSFDPGVSTGTLKYVYTLAGLTIIYLFHTTKSFSYPKWIYVLVNMVVWGVIIYNIFYTFLPVNRLNRYCFPYITILLPILCVKIKRPSRYIIEGCILGCFLLFMVKALSNSTYNFDFYFI